MARAARVLPLLLVAGAAACVPVPPPAMSGRSAPLPAAGDALVRPEGYRLVWSDEFDTGDRPDPARWHYETLRNRKGWFNDEQQYYSRDRRENARIEAGRLIIDARHETLGAEGRADWSGQAFTSARLTTRGKAAWRHAFIEVRAKLPCVRGAWPAIWLLPEHQDMRWQGGEIDIAETVGYEPRTVHHAVQTADRNFARGNHARAVSTTDYCGTFHDYQMLWTPDRILIGIDGKVAFATSDVAPFDRRMALILNVAVGGPWAGAQGIDTAGFPARMEVERIGVWQRNPGK